MFALNRFSKLPYGTIPIYITRLHQNRNRQGVRFFQTSRKDSFIFNFNSSSQDGTSNTQQNSKVKLALSKDKTPPKPRIKWFYATDIPNSRPELYNYERTEQPKKFLPFSDQDSDRLEKQFTNLDKGEKQLIPGFEPHMVPVHEDRLFECDLQSFELKPIYWEGAVFEIRRGLWFDKDNTPLSRELSDKLESLYNEIKPFTLDLDMLEDTMSLTKTIDDKTAVFTADDSVYLLSNDSSFTKFQVNYLIKSVIPPLLPVEKFSRGYKVDASKEKQNLSQDKKSTLDNPKEEDKLVNDYSNKSNQYENDRDIDHLVICVHGIGQVLGTKFESVNFIHTINVLRQTMKKVFLESERLKNLVPSESEASNCRVQVLPIVWRHKLDLNSAKKNENDVSLSDITIDELRPLRNMLGDILLDILLYYEPRYLNQILDKVVEQANEVYDKYLEKNPKFDGKVSLVGHSLGSAICLDILSRQPDSLKDVDPLKNLKFEVENFFALGSPIGVFSLLRNTKISPRKYASQETKSPKVKNFYNIFHPSDPVAYRVEPLIHQEFSHYKPAIIPFASKNIDAQLQNLTQIGDDLTNKLMDNLNTALNTIKVQNKKQMLEKKEEVTSQVSMKALEVMTKLNYSGRVDYSLPASIFDISIVSAINSHVSYFEEPNVSGFLLRELLLTKKIVTDKQVLLMDQEAEEDDDEFFTHDEEKSI